MRRAARCGVVLVLALLLAGNTFIPYYESHAGRIQCLLKHSHHVAWEQVDGGSVSAHDTLPGTHHHMCCHQKPYVSPVTFMRTAMLGLLAPIGTVQRHAPRGVPDILIEVRVPPA